MTYQDAEKLSFENAAAVRIEPKYIAMRYLGTIIAPEGNLQLKEKIFLECMEHGRNNRDVILELGLFGSEMYVFVAAMVKGKKIIMTLENYLSAINSSS